MSFEKNKKKIDKILELTQERVADEVGGLMGATMSMSDLSTRLISKEDFFDERSGKMIFSEMQLSGEIEGDGCILVSVKDAIRLGGTLIMLPENELDESVSSEDYSEEIEDSYGEIANIIAGAYTKTFEEMYSKNFRFIRKKLEIITPVKVDVESDKPIPNQNYYQVSSAMTLNDAVMGNLTLLIPAEAFGLDEKTSVSENVATENTAIEDTEVASGTTATDETGKSQKDITGNDQTEDETISSEKAPPAPENTFDVKKQKKRVDACLKECSVRMADEVGAMLGAEVQLTEHATRIVNKEDYFFDEVSGKQVLAHMDVTGDKEGKSYLYIGLKDAIFIGGTLIMLPPSELDVQMSQEEFGDDTEDAYGEITNIISGVYTKVFEELYLDKIRFIKTNLEQVVPMKVDAESEEPMPDVLYYMTTSKVTIGDKGLGNLQMLIPLDILKLEALTQEAAADDAPEQERTKGTVSGKVTSDGHSSSLPGAKQSGDAAQNPEFLLVSNADNACSNITAVLNERGIAYKILDYKENVSDYLPGDVKAVFLVMSVVDEQGLGVAIKISSSSALPLIAVGADWTRTKVIKAVKYGVDDILLSPASSDDIIQKIESVQAKMAA